jgi:aspartate aminotransferase-like enzyme
MEKHYLLAPGPTPIPPEILLAMARPIVHHRAPVYEQLLQEVAGEPQICLPDPKGRY